MWSKKLLEIDLKLVELDVAKNEIDSQIEEVNNLKEKYELYQEHIILNTDVEKIFPVALLEILMNYCLSSVTDVCIVNTDL